MNIHTVMHHGKGLKREVKLLGDLKFVTINNTHFEVTPTGAEQVNPVIGLSSMIYKTGRSFIIHTTAVFRDSQ